MNKSMELSVSGIKCDHCDYRDDSVKLEDYKDWLNKPCPKCGANLLTEADHQLVLAMTALVEDLNTLDLNPDNEELSRVELEMNGTGTVKVKES